MRLVGRTIRVWLSPARAGRGRAATYFYSGVILPHTRDHPRFTEPRSCGNVGTLAGERRQPSPFGGFYASPRPRACLASGVWSTVPGVTTPSGRVGSSRRDDSTRRYGAVERSGRKAETGTSGKRKFVERACRVEGVSWGCRLRPTARHPPAVRRTRTRRWQRAPRGVRRPGRTRASSSRSRRPSRSGRSRQPDPRSG